MTSAGSESLERFHLRTTGLATPVAAFAGDTTSGAEGWKFVTKLAV
jgi:hypothetical protein